MRYTYVLSVFMLTSLTAWSNSIAVNNVSIASQNTTLKYKMVKLDVTWQNSWRTYTYESNYDAAWVFVKYRKLGDAIWKHATLNYVNGTADGHTKAASSDINTTADGKGVFVFRANAAPTNFIGTANYVNMQLRWNYGVDGLADTDLVEIAVMAIEMVYVPQGSFYVGDGAPGSESGMRFQDGSSSTPFYITSEAQLTLGGTTAGNLSRTGTNSVSNPNDDFSQTTSRTLSATFPKGFKAFYCMKYEISQEQYAEFLKKLTPDQATLRYPNNYGVNRFTINLSYTAEVPDRACSFLRWHDGIAYADWAGLRPMTELEYEKACRGPVYPVAGEYAWGTTIFRRLASFANDGTQTETDGDTPRANVHFHQGLGTSTTNPLYGAVRVGFTVGGSRENSGDTFYGISDMSGSMEEIVVGTGTVINRTFTGSHGDGTLTTSGHATNSDWPGYNATLARVSDAVYLVSRGGSIFGSGSTPDTDRIRVSRRSTYYNYSESDTRMPFYGFRAVRSAQ